MRRARLAGGTLISATVALAPMATNVRGCVVDSGSGISSRFRAGPQWFHHDRVGKFFADAQSGIANLADEIALPAEKFHNLLFPKTKFAQAVADFRRAGELFHANHRPGFDLA